MSVVIENIKAIEKVAIPTPRDGGIVVLRGRNGRGKTTALDAVDSLLSGQGTLDKRDGAAAGSVHGFGATITVKRSCRREGQLEVESLEGKLSIADLIDPKIGDPEKADARRIKALIQLSGAAADLERFRHLFDEDALGAYRELEANDAPSDLIALAGLVKKQLEREARAAESKALQSSGSATAFRSAAGQIDRAQTPPDVATLQRAHEDAIRHEADLKARSAAGKKALAAAESAELDLLKARAGYQGLSVVEADVRNRTAVDELAAARERLLAAQRAVALAESEVKLTAQALKAAQDHESNIAGWQKSIVAAASVVVPSDGELAAATQAVQTARQAIADANKLRESMANLERAELHEEAATEQKRRAEQLRYSAKATDQVLSEAVSRLGCPLRVKDGRLVLDTDRGEELFGDLSDGERCRVALDTVIRYLPPEGVLTLSQTFWSELDPINRRELAELCRDRGVLLITAEATADEELTAAEYGE